MEIDKKISVLAFVQGEGAHSETLNKVRKVGLKMPGYSLPVTFHVRGEDPLALVKSVDPGLVIVDVNAAFEGLGKSISGVYIIEMIINNSNFSESKPSEHPEYRIASGYDKLSQHQVWLYRQDRK